MRITACKENICCACGRVCVHIGRRREATELRIRQRERFDVIQLVFFSIWQCAARKIKQFQKNCTHLWRHDARESVISLPTHHQSLRNFLCGARVKPGNPGWRRLILDVADDNLGAAPGFPIPVTYVCLDPRRLGITQPSPRLY